MIAFLLAQTIAITGGTVYPVSGPKITNATVLIRDGKIVAVGAGVAVPSHAPPLHPPGEGGPPRLIGGGGPVGLGGGRAPGGAREGNPGGGTNPRRGHR